MSLTEIWARVFDRVRREVAVPTVWLAMQAVRPLTIDGNFFVATLPPESQYLAINLQGFEATTAIEEALQAVTGRVLAFRLIEGQTLADWQREKGAGSALAVPVRTWRRRVSDRRRTAPARSRRRDRHGLPDLGKTQRAAGAGLQDGAALQISAGAGALHPGMRPVDLGHDGYA